MPAVGAYLRELRERQGVSLDEIARSTRVLHHYLEALESDNLASLPAPVFAKGFIRAYCQVLGVAPDEALGMYDQKVVQSRTQATSRVPPARGVQPARPAAPPRPVRAPSPASAASPAPPTPPASAPEVPAAPPDASAAEQPAPAPAKDAAAPAPTPSPAPHFPAPRMERAVVEHATVERTVERAHVERRESRSRGAVLISFVLLVVLGAALFAVTTALQSGRDEVESATAVHVAASPAPVSIPTSAPEPASSEPAPLPSQPVVAAPPPKQTPISGAATLSASAPPPPAVASQPPSAPLGPYRLVARTTETTWIRVRTEDGRTSEETVPANEVREWVSNGPFVLSIGNAGGVSLELNGRPVPRLGASGAVINRMVLPPNVQ
jgi:cytoskeleton protein RodZ